MQNRRCYDLMAILVRAVLIVVVAMLWPAGVGSIHASKRPEGSDPRADSHLLHDRWEFVKETKGVRVYNRNVPDSPVHEVMARGVIKAPSWRVFAVIYDIDDRYDEFMPYVSQSNTVRKDAENRWIFHYLDFPWPIANRYYTIRVTPEASRPEEAFYRLDWELAKDEVYDPLKGVLTPVNVGFWELWPINAGAHTHVTYVVHTDPGGWVPKWAVRMANNIALPNVIEAVRERVKLPDYDKFAPGKNGREAGTSFGGSFRLAK